MREVTELVGPGGKPFRGLLFDLDDSFCEGSRLDPDAYQALFRLAKVGYRLVAVTGRSAALATTIVRQWPIDGCVAENGALAVFRSQGGILLQGLLGCRFAWGNAMLSCCA